MLILFCLLIILASLLGGVVPLLIVPTHRRMQFAMSCIGGVMAGIAVLDLLPEALAYGETKVVMLWLLVGFLTIFLLERFLPSHCHDIVEKSHDHPHSCGHEHKLTWVGAYAGLTLHSILAGVALGAAWSAGGVEVALGVFVAIVLHKPFDGLTIISMMRIAKISKAKTHAGNLIFSLGVPIGVLLFHFGGAVSHPAIAAALAFSAGMFLCISLSDLLPELQFHGHDRFGLTFALILGLAIAWGISSLHSHESEEHTHESHGESSILHEH
jgi:zinc and cadmium transporter